MTLQFTEQEEAFRAKARTWPAEHSPGRLPSMNTEDGARAHRQWERTPAGGHWSVVAREAREPVDPDRRMFDVEPGEPVGRIGADRPAVAPDAAALACAATLLGAGALLLKESVAYAGVRRRFGRVIGAYQAVEHALTDVHVSLDFARPLARGEAPEPAARTGDAPRDVSAAKVACADAAYLADRTAPQIHGAIGCTPEFDLSPWLLKVRALVGAWGTTAAHRTRVLDALVRS
ncbi:acyl-CoA dehydrogenase family protein [Streptomyces sp. NPDC002523]